jgi:superfamily II DNA/RNA helicase
MTDFELAGKLETSPEAAARIRRLTELVDTHKSTLIFVNSRQNAEMLGHKLSQLGRTDIAVHHGSLSKEERISIEDEFKAGKLKAIICTSTLELGIDIGNVDLTIQYMSPRQVSSLIQRVGRSGHSLERLSEGVIVTVYPDDTGIGCSRNKKPTKLTRLSRKRGRFGASNANLMKTRHLQRIQNNPQSIPYHKLTKKTLGRHRLLESLNKLE